MIISTVKIINNNLLFHEQDEMIDSQLGTTCLIGYDHLISNKREWNNNCFIKNNQEILLDLAGFTSRDQPEDNLMVAISQ